MKNTVKKVTTLLVSALTVCTGALGGCGKKENNDGSLRFYVAYGSYLADATKDSIWLEIEKETGVQFTVEGEEHGSSYYSRLSPMLASKDIPDLVFTVPDMANGAYEEYVSQGYFYDIGKLIAEKPNDYPYLTKIMTSDQYGNFYYIDRKGEKIRSFLPKIGEHSGWGIYYREDWLKQIGYVDESGNAKTPVTLEDFQYVMQEFSGKGTSDLNKNNNQAYGFVAGLSSEMTFLGPLMGAFGVNYGFDLDENNEVVYMYERKEIEGFANWFKEMIANGYVDKQINSFTDNEAREKFYTGKAGILVTNIGSATGTIATQLSNRTGGSIVFGNAPEGTANLGKAGAKGFPDFGGYWGGFSIGVNCKRPHDVLRVLEYLYSPEGQMLAHYGIEGTHYTIVDGEVQPNVETREEEPLPSRFYYSTKQGDNYETGSYRLGGMITGNVDWAEYEKTGVIMSKFDPRSADAVHWELLADAYQKNKDLATGKLLNMTFCLSAEDTLSLNKVTDAAESYLLRAILGTSGAETYEQMQTKINSSSYNWSSLKEKIKARAQESGVI